MIKLTSKDVDFVWSPECENAASLLKGKIVSSPILVFPDFTREFMLTTDASAIAVGAVLSQKRDDGKDHPVAFYSRALSAVESRWDACQQELFAILCAVKHYRGYLMNTHFKIRTDNVACTYILTKADLSPKLARWAVQLADYQYDIEHTSGKDNVVADALSRAEEVVAIEAAVTSTVDEEMRRAQSKDYYLGPILMYLETGKHPADMTKRNATRVRTDCETFTIQDGVVYKKHGDELLLAIPVCKRKDLLYSAHESLMSLHPGVTKTMLRLRDKYWFPGMQREVEKHIAECGSCQSRKNPKLPIRVPLKNQMAEFPFQVLSVDFQGPFVESESGMKHILVWTDHFTKWCEMEPTKDQLATTVAKSYVERIFCRFGASERLLSDRAKNFLSEIGRAHV
jgi:hypothetical protein